MNYSKYGIIGVFVIMFGVAMWGVLLVRRLTPYMRSTSWTVRVWAFVLLAVAQFHGIAKTVFSDHHFNIQDFAYFLELLIVYIGLNMANWLLLKDWQRFPLFARAEIQAGEKK